MFIPDGVDEEYLAKKLAHLLFEITEFPKKREILYLAVCYCQLSLWGIIPSLTNFKGFFENQASGRWLRGMVNSPIMRGENIEISITSLERCLKRYLIDLERYPWKDYLMEYEIFYLRKGKKFLSGRDIVAEDTFLEEDEDKPIESEVHIGIDPRYIHLKNQFCSKVLTYWKHLSHLEDLKTPRSGEEVLRNAVRLINLGLYVETEIYLDEYLPYLLLPHELLFYRILKLIARANSFILAGLNQQAVDELERLEKFLKDFKDELKVWEYNFSRLAKQSRKLRKLLRKNKTGFPLMVEKKGETWKDKLKRFFGIKL